MDTAAAPIYSAGKAIGTYGLVAVATVPAAAIPAAERQTASSEGMAAFSDKTIKNSGSATRG